MNIRKTPKALNEEEEGIGSIHTGTKFHPYWNQVPSLLEPSSIHTGTKFHPYWNQVPFIPEPSSTGDEAKE